MLASFWCLLVRGQQREATNGLDRYGVPRRQGPGDGIQDFRRRRALSPCKTERNTALEPGVPIWRKAEEAFPRCLSVRISRRGPPVARRGQEAVGLGRRSRGQQEGREADRRHLGGEHLRRYRRGISATHRGRRRRRVHRHEESVAACRSGRPRPWRPAHRGYHPGGNPRPAATDRTQRAQGDCAA